MISINDYLIILHKKSYNHKNTKIKHKNIKYKINKYK